PEREREGQVDRVPDQAKEAGLRHAIYLSFALTLWTVPVWTPDQLMVALTLTAYCVAAPILKERRFAAIHGAEFQAYRARVPYMLPLPRAGRRRAELQAQTQTD
ncbi:MAG: hypothetical protein AAFR47_13365, partial [Pseudomonadota bacterium]